MQSKFLDNEQIKAILNMFSVSECYIISDYSCPQLQKYQKVLENEFYIDVGLKSIIQPIPGTTTVPKTWFRFVSKSHLIELGEMPPYYPDFIGVLSKIRDYTKTNGEVFVLLILTNESGSELAINLWKQCITNPHKFNRASIDCSSTPTVVAVTNLKPSKSNGALRHGSSHATHIYVNPDIPETTSLINLFTGPSRPIPTLSGTPSTKYNMKLKNRYDLLKLQSRNFTSKTPSTKQHVQSVKIRFSEGANSGIAVHMDSLESQLTLTIIDTIDTIPAVVSETASQKLLKSPLEKFISDSPLPNRNTLPTIITDKKKQTKTMCIQMLRASTTDNICFIIIDIQESTTPLETPITTTRAQAQMTECD
ncbi:unnamed protein product [Lactuca saligna]|uniref:Uncharacterized protein n=1 Tax=Lactuca saligna TaxID=75948 RepID=A0AA35Y3P4_LACSI|nr:unnamed protein product [Lactuca saligna]